MNKNFKVGRDDVDNFGIKVNYLHPFACPWGEETSYNNNIFSKHDQSKDHSEHELRVIQSRFRLRNRGRPMGILRIFGNLSEDSPIC